MFADAAFRDEVRLSAVNSINWARVMAQIVYYVTACRALAPPLTVAGADRQLRQRLRRLDRPPPRCADQRLRHLLERQRHPHPLRQRRRHDHPRRSFPTLSPSMDIQVSSNFERLLFEMNDRDGGLTAEQLLRFRAVGPPRRRGRPARPLDTRHVPRRPRRRRGDARRDRPRVRHVGRAASIRTPPRRRRPASALAVRRGAQRRLARHRASGQVPRCGRAGDRRPPCGCPITSPTCSSVPSGRSTCRTTSARCEKFVRRCPDSSRLRPCG